MDGADIRGISLPRLSSPRCSWLFLPLCEVGGQRKPICNDNYFNSLNRSTVVGLRLSLIGANLYFWQEGCQYFKADRLLVSDT
jgi:hypothetical protein